MRRIALALSLPLALLLGACEGDNNLPDPLLVTDTVELTTPTSASSLPTALDASAAGGVMIPGRYPEEEVDAEEWDLALRFAGGELTFVPAGKIGISDLGGISSAGITQALTGTTFQGLELAPPKKDFVTDAGVALRVGNVYAVRTRLLACGLSAFENYAKIQPLEIDIAEQRVKLQIVANGQCGDRRLVEED